LLQQTRKARALARLREIGLQRIQVGRQRPIPYQELRNVFVRSDDIRRIESQRVRERHRKALRDADVRAARGARVGNQRGIAPQRLAVGSPPRAERPARATARRIPLALPLVDEASRANARLRRRSNVSASSRFFGESAA
jgi:hypothetical protein